MGVYFLYAAILGYNKSPPNRSIRTEYVEGLGPVVENGPSFW
jgi:hypothetical protein